MQRPRVKPGLPVIVNDVSPLSLYLQALRKAEAWRSGLQEDVPIPRPMLRTILAVISRDYKIRPIDIKSKRRNADIVLPRQVFCFLAREKTLQSYPYIGRFLGGRDHTTVLHAVRKIEFMQKSDLALAEKIRWLSAVIDFEFASICEANGIGIPNE